MDFQITKHQNPKCILFCVPRDKSLEQPMYINVPLKNGQELLLVEKKILLKYLVACSVLTTCLF